MVEVEGLLIDDDPGVLLVQERSGLDGRGGGNLLKV